MMFFACQGHACVMGPVRLGAGGLAGVQGVPASPCSFGVTRAPLTGPARRARSG